MARVAIIGGGSMGEAVLSGLRRAGRPAKDMVVAEKQPDRSAYIAETYSVRVTADIADAVENADVVVIAVKPADVDHVIDQIAKMPTAASDNPDQVLVPIVAGVTTGYLEAKLRAGTAVVRVMPNTPTQVRAGTSVLSPGSYASESQVAEVAALWECLGHVTTVPERQLEAVTAISGSGPAYFFLLIEALVDSGVAVGLSRQVATELAVQTMSGSAEMLREHLRAARGDVAEAGAAPGAAGAAPRLDTTPAQLRAMVTSPGGTTAAALRELERAGFRGAVDRAVQAAKTRADELRITSE